MRKVASGTRVRLPGQLGTGTVVNVFGHGPSAVLEVARDGVVPSWLRGRVHVTRGEVAVLNDQTPNAAHQAVVAAGRFPLASLAAVPAQSDA